MRTYPQAIKQDAISGLRRFSEGFPWVVAEILSDLFGKSGKALEMRDQNKKASRHP
ncbi:MULTISPECIES: hypothetical protein [Rhizobium]|uniref:hypothetical protein n=1 Tax=Rhizobium phaseoli TaxID=396 RepID=UPI0013564BE7|nr:hypothetical protein [Rhizobium phaseoli]